MVDSLKIGYNSICSFLLLASNQFTDSMQISNYYRKEFGINGYVKYADTLKIENIAISTKSDDYRAFQNNMQISIVESCSRLLISYLKKYGDESGLGKRIFAVPEIYYTNPSNERIGFFVYIFNGIPFLLDFQIFDEEIILDISLKTRIV